MTDKKEASGSVPPRPEANINETESDYTLANIQCQTKLGDNYRIKTTTPTAPAFLGNKQTAGRVNLGITKFKEMCSSGGFGVKPLRAGRKLLFPAAELEKYIEASTQAGRFITFDVWQKMRGAK